MLVYDRNKKKIKQTQHFSFSDFKLNFTHCFYFYCSSVTWCLRQLTKCDKKSGLKGLKVAWDP